MRPGNLSDYPLKKRKASSRSINILARQAARWSTAANQDENPMIAILHANYGAAYLWALQDIATPREIEAVVTDLNWKRFRDEITRAQDKAAHKLAKICSDFAPKSYLAKIGGER